MECPHCHRSLPSLLCQACGAQVPEESLFCFKCGRPVERKQEPVVEDDFSDRKLCSDGACIGVINESGVCNICGKPYTGDPL
jgi:hypothetical protein